ncbi:MAG: tRNA (guanosine(37)-N1)-methyltransferase TrmD [Candidatus Eisenbacteria bacterium]
MNITVITIFPSMFGGFLSEGLVARAVGRGIAGVSLLNLRDHATDGYRRVDDYPYGGGPGMVMKPEPILRAVGRVVGKDYVGDDACFSGAAARSAQAMRPPDEHPSAEDRGTVDGVAPLPRVVILTPQGKRYDQRTANELALSESLVLVCGRYKAIDERVSETLGADEISIGDYVLSGGEIAAMAVIESVVRLLSGAMEDEDSAAGDSFQDGILDCAYYTRPETIAGLRVPDVLLSGNHEAIRRWRKRNCLERTIKRRPDLVNPALLDEEGRKLLEELH